MTTPVSASLVRVPLTLAAALAFHVSMSPPTTAPAARPSTSDPDKAGDKSALYTLARLVVSGLTKGLFWASALTDAFLLLAPHLPTTLLHPLRTLSLPPPTSPLLPWLRPTLPSLPTYLTWPTIAGTSLALTGALFRHRAFLALGQLYACPNLGPGPCTPYRIGTRGRGHAHVLITSGPYAYVRHPGYAGLALCTVGIAVLQLDALAPHLHAGVSSSWGIAERASVTMRSVALVCALLGTLGAMRRIRDEERALKTRFKREWEEWAARVPYKLVPGVY